MSPSTDPSDRPHLVFLGHGSERTGPPILLGHLLGVLGRTGRYRISVVTARSGPMDSAYRSAGADVFSITASREPLEFLSAALRRLGPARLVPVLQRQARRHALRGLRSPDLVYVNAATPPTAGLLRALALAPSVPVLLHVHELDIGLRMTLDDDDRRFLLDRADHLVAASEPVARLLVEGHGVEAERVTTCREFIDVDAVAPLPRDQTRRRLGVPAEARVIGSVGLPDWRKAPELLLHAVVALDRLQPELKPWVVWIGGDPRSDDGRRLANEAERIGLADRFVHHPHTDRPDRILGAVDVFALPAREDACPLAALEAGAAGLPLVCFWGGGIEVLARAGAGTAVQYPDVQAFGAALADLLEDDRQRRDTGQRAALLVRDHHSHTEGANALDHVIQTLLSAASRRSDADGPGTKLGS